MADIIHDMSRHVHVVNTMTCSLTRHPPAQPEGPPQLCMCYNTHTHLQRPSIPPQDFSQRPLEEPTRACKLMHPLLHPHWSHHHACPLQRAVSLCTPTRASHVPLHVPVRVHGTCHMCDGRPPPRVPLHIRHPSTSPRRTSLFPTQQTCSTRKWTYM